jgi:DNA topoisomerase I
MKLVIVESPAKAKTIEKYLGKDYTVRASVGHIRDLPKNNKKAIDIEGGFTPTYEISKGKEEVVANLTKLAKKASEVILATDPDREGEAIAWHIAEALKLKKPKRVAFHEITKEAVQEAIKNPRLIDQDLKEAQEARRVLDRLVGYDLSGLIWKKVRYGLSAGRVQSPALRILMEREREIRAFIPEDYFTIEASLKHTKETLLFTCVEEPRDKKEKDQIVKLGEKESWIVESVKESNVSRNPRAPFTTSTLQQAASSELGFAPSKAMSVAQKLYEAGLITYMRTDSTTMSKQALGQIFSHIEGEYGKKYLSPRTFKTKSKNAQEAHEAVRPTNCLKPSLGNSPDQKRLYSLIWKRAVASQMTAADTLRTRIVAQIEKGDIPDFTVNGSRITFDGWLKAYPEARGADVELPEVSEGDSLKLKEMVVEAKQTTPPQRYSEAGLVKELEKRGIGRPSTYASIIKTLQDRGYVLKENKALIPTDTGDVVSSFLEENFEYYISDSFTAEMEDKLDQIAEGKQEYEKTLKDFYKPFTKEVKSKENIEKITNLGDAPKEFPCPLCKKKMVIKLSKNGKFMSCATFPDCAGARTIEGVELEGPKETGEMCPDCTKGKLIERDGKFGRFIACERYPKCKFIKQDPEEAKKASTGVTCPMCEKGDMVERRGRFGLFYSCSQYPDCKNAIKARPTGKICGYMKETGKCKALMMQGTKTIPDRCSDKTCPNHNPHKLEKKA